ncbi:MAG: hypothetical protein Q8Q32_01310 [bacterium]|nr:hypothetical protein [bacterium]
MLERFFQWLWPQMTENMSTQVVCALILVALMVMRTIIFLDCNKKIDDEKGDIKKLNKLRNEVNGIKFVVVTVQVVAFSAALILGLVLHLPLFWIFAIVAAIWERNSYVYTDVVDINVRQGTMGRRSGDSAICKEGIDQKWPWEKVRTYHQLVENHQGEVEFIAGTGIQKDDPDLQKDGSHRGSLKASFTLQDRISTSARDASGRIRSPEMSVEVILQGIRDRIEGTTINAATVHTMDQCLGSKPAFELMARCALELEEMPHEETKVPNKPEGLSDDEEKLWDRYGRIFSEISPYGPKTMRDDGLGYQQPAGGYTRPYPIPDRDLLTFYTLNRRAILRGRLNFSAYRQGNSWFERTYGRDVINFSITKLLPSDKKLQEALDGPRKLRALADAIKALREEGYDLATAQRLAKAAAGIATVTELDVSGGGAIPFINVGNQQKGGK